ncbi:reverse transcriptase domain-containing protein [Acinetobacter sp. ANC 3781]
MINSGPIPRLIQATTDEQFRIFSTMINNKKGRGIRQGMPIASLLASFYLQDFEIVLQNAQIEFVRYADDLVVFANTRDEIEKHFELIRHELNKIQLSIPDIGSGKSEIYTSSQTVIFLGLELKKVGTEFKLFIPQKAFSELNKKIIELQGYKKNIKTGLNFYKTCQKMDQICNGYIVCYEFTSNLNEFKKHVEERKSFVYKRLLAPLGIDYTKLSSEKKKYFFNE